MITRLWLVTCLIATPASPYNSQNQQLDRGGHDADAQVPAGGIGKPLGERLPGLRLLRGTKKAGARMGVLGDAQVREDVQGVL